MQQDFAALTVAYGLERFGIVVDREPVGDDRRQIQATAQQLGHFVPGFEHFAAIDPFQVQAFEQHVIPVDLGMARQKPEQGNVTPVGHGVEQVFEGIGVAGHFQSDVKAFGHAQVSHGCCNTVFVRFDNRIGAQGFRQVKAQTVDVGDGDMTCPDKTTYRCGHDADRARAGDQDVFANDIEGQRTVHGVAERVEDSRDVRGNLVGHGPEIGRGNGDIFGECAVPAAADADGLVTEMAFPGAAVPAQTASDMSFGRDAVPGLIAIDLIADGDDLTNEFMTDDTGGDNITLCPGIPVENVQIGAADAGGFDFNQNFIGVAGRDGGFFEPDSRLGFCFDQGFHGGGHGILFWQGTIGTLSGVDDKGEIMNPDLTELMAVVSEAADKELLPRFRSTGLALKDDGSVVTEADLAMHRRLRAVFEQRWPEIPVLSEEMPAAEQQALLERPAARVWCVDPLDGTSNFAAGLPFFAVSVALICDGWPVLGVVVDPLRKEVFGAEQGRGACLNGERLTTAGGVSLRESLALVDFKRLSPDLAQRLAVCPPYRSQRSFGSVALDWCWLAANRCHVYLHGRQKVWDYAAGWLVLHEAGGVSQTLEGKAVFDARMQPCSAVAAGDAVLLAEWAAWLVSGDQEKAVRDD